MKQNKKITALFSVLLGIISLSTMADEKIFAVASIKSLKSDIIGGSVVIKTIEGNVPTKVVYKKESLNAGCRLDLSLKGSKLIVNYKKSTLVSHQSCNVDFEITVPSKIDIEIAHEHGVTTISGSYTSIELKLVRTTLDFKATTPKLTMDTVSTDSTLQYNTLPVSVRFELRAVGGSTHLKLNDTARVYLEKKGMMSQVKNDFSQSLNGAFQIDAKLMTSPLIIEKYKN